MVVEEPDVVVLSMEIRMNSQSEVNSVKFAVGTKRNLSRKLFGSRAESQENSSDSRAYPLGM